MVFEYVNYLLQCEYIINKVVLVCEHLHIFMNFPLPNKKMLAQKQDCANILQNSLDEPYKSQSIPSISFFLGHLNILLPLNETHFV